MHQIREPIFCQLSTKIYKIYTHLLSLLNVIRDKVYNLTCVGVPQRRLAHSQRLQSIIWGKRVGTRENNACSTFPNFQSLVILLSSWLTSWLHISLRFLPHYRVHYKFNLFPLLNTKQARLQKSITYLFIIYYLLINKYVIDFWSLACFVFCKNTQWF